MVYVWLMYSFHLCIVVVINMMYGDVSVYDMLVYDAHTRKYSFSFFRLNPSASYILKYGILVINVLSLILLQKKVKKSCIVGVGVLIINMLKIPKI